MREHLAIAPRPDAITASRALMRVSRAPGHGNSATYSELTLDFLRPVRLALISDQALSDYGSDTVQAMHPPKSRRLRFPETSADDSRADAIGHDRQRRQPFS